MNNNKTNTILENFNNKISQLNNNNKLNYYNFDTPSYIKYHSTLFGESFILDSKREELFLGNSYSSDELLENKINKYNLVNPYNKVCIKNNILSQGINLSSFNNNIIIPPDQMQENIFRIPNLYTNFKDIHYYLTAFSNINVDNIFYNQLLKLTETLGENIHINYYDYIITSIEDLDNETNNNKEKHYQILAKVLEYMHIFEYRLISSKNYKYVHGQYNILKKINKKKIKNTKNPKLRKHPKTTKSQKPHFGGISTPPTIWRTPRYFSEHLRGGILHTQKKK